ncbi:MAG: pseudaminic acid synthase [Verrucomicrobia bacterium]|nr:MAG: pseudaminic acid synthase [Verrucomicrobiota bacterium]
MSATRRAASPRQNPSRLPWPATFRLGRRIVGDGRPPFLVAELSANHRQQKAHALALIDAAADAGADAIKLQTYTPDTLTLPARTRPFRLGKGLWEGRYLHDLYREAMTPWEWHAELAAHARARGLLAFSTPFDETAVDFLEREMRPPAYKIASFEINHLPLLRRVGATGRPVILSTGMATEPEIATAVQTLRAAGCPALLLLKCVSSYPARPADFNLRAIGTLHDRFRAPVGLSDHTLSDEVALGAVALGASLIEKHLTLRRDDGGIDAGFSLEPAEFRRMATAVRTLHAALGADTLGPSRQDRSQRRFRRSIFVAADVAPGEILTAENLRIVRPADGLDPRHWDEVLGRRARRRLKAGTPLRQGDWL